MNNLFLLTVLLTLLWAAVSGSFSLPNLIFGYLLAVMVLFLIREQVGALSFLARTKRITSLVLLFLVELVKSAVKVAKIAVTPNLDLKPGIFAYELTTKSDFEITLLANLITLTPGTLSVDVSQDKKVLYVHAVTIDDVEEMRADIRDGFERKIMEAFR